MTKEQRDELKRLCAEATSAEKVAEAFHIIHRVATGQSTASYMSIPADPKRDADLLVGDALTVYRDLLAAIPALLEEVEGVERAARVARDDAKEADANEEITQATLDLVQAERDTLRAKLAKAEADREACYVVATEGSIPLVAEAIRAQPISVMLKVAARNIKDLEADRSAAVEELRACKVRLVEAEKAAERECPRCHESPMDTSCAACGHGEEKDAWKAKCELADELLAASEAQVVVMREALEKAGQCLPDSIHAEDGTWNWCWEELSGEAQDEVKAARALIAAALASAPPSLPADGEGAGRWLTAEEVKTVREALIDATCECDACAGKGAVLSQNCKLAALAILGGKP